LVCFEGDIPLVCFEGDIPLVCFEGDNFEVALEDLRSSIFGCLEATFG